MSAEIVGAWRTTVTIEGMPPFVNLTSIFEEGIVHNIFPTPSAAQPGAGHTLEFFTTAVGSWKATGSNKVLMSFETLGVDEHGNPIGSHVISATVDIAAGGLSWSGPFTLTIMDSTGKEAGSVSGNVNATRMTP